MIASRFMNGIRVVMGHAKIRELMQVFVGEKNKNEHVNLQAIRMRQS